jgi:hypothetical protein
MDGLPTELVKLCHLASLAECGDHFWESVPALGVWAAAWTPVTRRWASWRGEARDILQDGRGGNLPAGT